MDEYIDVKIDVFEHIGQRARLRKFLTIRALVDEVLKEFDDIAADVPEKYGIFRKGSDTPLMVNATLTDLDIQHQDELVFKSIYQNDRQNLDPHQHAFLYDEAGALYKIEWQPAIIGRPNNDVRHDMNLAVNLQSHPQRQTISRSHAQITFSSGHYYIEPLSELNPLLIDGKKIPFNTRQEIHDGAKISMGAKGLQMLFRTQASDAKRSVADAPAETSASASIDHATPLQQGQESVTSQNTPKAILVIENANDENRIGQTIELKQFPSVVGRKISLLESEKDVSRQHAAIDYDPTTGKFSIKDLISANGVFINGERLKPNQDYELRSDTRIHLGPKLVLRFAL